MGTFLEYRLIELFLHRQPPFARMRVSLVFVASLAIFCMVEEGGADKCDEQADRYKNCRAKGFPSALGCPSSSVTPSKNLLRWCGKLEEKVKKCDSPCGFDASDKTCALDGWDFTDADLRNFQSSGYEDCNTACNDEDGCKSFAMRKSDNHCWLKTKYGAGGPMPDDNFISRNMDCDTSEVDLSCARDGIDFPMSDIRHFQSEGLEQCAQLCRMAEDSGLSP